MINHIKSCLTIVIENSKLLYTFEAGVFSATLSLLARFKIARDAKLN